MSTTATATTTPQGETPLRKRLRVLERAQSLSNLNGLKSSDIKILPLGVKHRRPSDEHAASSPTDYESHYESTEELDENSDGGEDEGGVAEAREPTGPQGDQHPASRPKVTVDMSDMRRSSSHKERNHMSPTTRAWYEFDLAVVVALVSPIGNWLTGGDHIKNLLLIVLLIFYLHQIIEVPWKLYQQSRPRRRALQMPPVDPNSIEGRYAQLAASELQKMEVLFLLLTFLSPILGATLLRYATATVLGPDSMSWFSTGLFILATGVRPWAHLVDRMKERTIELHNVIHYPSPTNGISEEQHRLLAERVIKLEKSLSKVRAKVTHTTEDVFEYVDDAVDAVEHAMRKQERKWDKYEGKVKEVEQVVDQLSRSTNNNRSFLFNVDAITAYMRTIMEHILPSWLLWRSRKSSSSTSKFQMPMNPLSGTSSSQPTTPLETIFEEDYASDRDRYPILAQPSKIASGLVYQAGYIATLPLRAVTRMVSRRY